MSYDGDNFGSVAGGKYLRELIFQVLKILNSFEVNFSNEVSLKTTRALSRLSLLPNCTGRKFIIFEQKEIMQILAFINIDSRILIAEFLISMTNRTLYPTSVGH